MFQKHISKPIKRKYVLRFAAKNIATWQAIKQGKKKIETRAATARYRAITPGDVLIFSCAGKKIEKEVQASTVHKTIRSLIRTYDPKLINPAGATTLKDMEAMYYAYPHYKEKIATVGIIAFVLR